MARKVRDIRKLSRACGGVDSFSLANYRLPGYNYNNNTWEKHLPWASYIGPGTDIQTRWVQKRLHGTTSTDEAARHHDAQYWNLGLLKAKNKINDQQLSKGIQNSDRRLLNKSQPAILSLNPVNKLHGVLTSAGIRGKQALQYTGVMNKTAFTTANNPQSKFIDEEVPRFVDELDTNYLQGGKKKKKDRLKRLKKSLKVHRS